MVAQARLDLARRELTAKGQLARIVAASCHETGQLASMLTHLHAGRDEPGPGRLRGLGRIVAAVLLLLLLPPPLAVVDVVVVLRLDNDDLPLRRQQALVPLLLLFLLGSSRIVASETEVPNMLVKLV
jgi:hypothetical protein